jgi:hypothetical protein
MADATPSILDGLVPGYPKLGAVMGLMPETACFRRFASLNAKSLLYQQSELIHLENELRELEARDAGSGDKMRERFRKNCRFLNDASEDDEQHDLVARIRIRLKEYGLQDPVVITGFC